MKYILDLDDSSCTHECGMDFYQCKQVPWLSVSNRVTSKLPPYTESDRKAIEDEVWEFVKEIILKDNGTRMSGMFENELNECFGYPYYSDMFANLSYQEAKSKYEAWKKQKDETFDTGDEVYDKEIDSKGVILRRYNSDTLDILWDDGSAGETIAIKAITKTGRHFPEVAELLEKMRGEEE